MKQRKITWSSGFILACMLISCGLLFSSYRAKQYTDDVWRMLGLSQQGGTDAVKNSFLNGYLYYYGAKNFRNIAVNDRAAVAKDMLAYTRTYVSGAEFKAQYEKMRNDAKPQQPELKSLRSIEEIQKDEIAKTEKSIRDTEKTLKEVSPEIGKGIRPLLDILRQNLKDYQNPKHPNFAAIALGEKYEQESRTTNYHEAMEKWENDFPAVINVFISAKLSKMLEATDNIDYAAQLVDKNGKKKFVNPLYEGKGTAWKQGFRAGKDVTETARAFAKKWLDELK